MPRIMEYTIRLRNRRLYEAVLQFLAEIGQDAKGSAVRKPVESVSDEFNAVRIKTKGFRFDRDEEDTLKFSSSISELKKML